MEKAIVSPKEFGISSFCRLVLYCRTRLVVYSGASSPSLISGVTESCLVLEFGNGGQDGGEAVRASLSCGRVQGEGWMGKGRSL